MQLIPVPASHIDQAWRDGAHVLAEACATSGGEITGDQLKLILARGERILLQLRDGETVKGWAAIRIDQYPNLRVLHVCEVTAHNGAFHRFTAALRVIARQHGCTEIRCCAGEAQARLYRMKCGFEPVYSTLRIPA